MSGYRKNVAVGATVLVALVLLGWMILRFSDAPLKLFTKPQMPVRFVASSAEGVAEGSAVYYKGVNVGHVVRVRRSPDDRHVFIDALLEQGQPLPANVEAIIRTQWLSGNSTINMMLAPAEGAATEPTRAVEPLPVGQLQPNAQIPARFEGTIPREFSELAIDLRQTSMEIRRFSQQVRQSDLLPSLEKSAQLLRDDLAKAGQVLDSVQRVVGDEGMQRNIKQAMANFQQASQQAVRIGQELEKISQKADRRLDELGDNSNKVLTTTQASIEDLSKKLSDRILQLASTMANLEAASRKLNEGKGTAAQLLNNPTLYENLLDTSKELSLTLADLRRLVEQWESEGMTVRLGGKPKRTGE